MPKVALFRILAEECRYLRLEFRVAESLWITLDLVECDFAAKFVSHTRSISSSPFRPHHAPILAYAVVSVNFQ